VFCDVSEYLLAGVCGVDKNGSPVCRPMSTLNQAALLHSIHDPGGARVRDVHRLGQAAHGQRALGLQRGEHIEVDQAQGVAVPLLEGAAAIAR
jgi:hypothetical protein